MCGCRRYSRNGKFSCSGNIGDIFQTVMMPESRSFEKEINGVDVDDGLELIVHQEEQASKSTEKSKAQKAKDLCEALEEVARLNGIVEALYDLNVITINIQKKIYYSNPLASKIQ